MLTNAMIGMSSAPVAHSICSEDMIPIVTIVPAKTSGTLAGIYSSLAHNGMKETITRPQVINVADTPHTEPTCVTHSGHPYSYLPLDSHLITLYSKHAYE
jgi:CelD/BcsL family acetyltransferase involved in cellulose biosynthesis